jgi:hypothetical protein
MKPLSQDDISYWMIPQLDAPLKRGDILSVNGKALQEALAWAKSWKQNQNPAFKCDTCPEKAIAYYNQDECVTFWACKDCLLSRAFGGIKDGS